MRQKTDKELAHGFGKMVKGVSSLLLEPDQLSDTQNMMPGLEWEQRRGLSELTATPVVAGLRFKSLVQFRDLQGYTDLILAHTYEGSGGEDLYKGSALPPNAITWSKVYDFTAGCVPCQWCNVANALLIANNKEFLIWRGNRFYPTAVWKYNSAPDQYTLFADELFDNDVATAMPLDGLNSDESFVIISEQTLDKVSVVAGDLNTAAVELEGFCWNGAWSRLVGAGVVESDGSFGTEDGTTLGTWDDDDQGDGATTEVTYDGYTSIKMDSGSVDFENRAVISKDFGTFGNTVTVTIRMYHDKIGIRDPDGDAVKLDIMHADSGCFIYFASDGMFINDGVSWNEVGTNIVDEDTWTTWTFVVDFSVAATANVDVYKDNVEVALAVDCSNVGAQTSGDIAITCYGNTAANDITYIDDIKVGAGLVASDGFVDGTLQDDATIGKSGDLTWTLRTDEVLTDIQGVPGFAYKFQPKKTLDNPTSITGISVHAPMGPVRSVWHGLYEFVSGCYVNDGTDNTDYTAYVNNGVESQYMDLTDVTTTDKIYVGFPTRVNKIIFRPAAEGKNTNNVSVTAVKYHNAAGVATTVGTVIDTTETSDKMFSQKGYMSWADPGWQNEKMTIIGGDLTPMYWYEITVDAALVDPTYIFHIQGVSIPRDPDPCYGVFAYKRRAWQVAPRNRENQVRFSAQDLPNVWEGPDAGYVEFGERPLFAAGPFYNETVLYADTEMWMLQGNSPTNFGRLRLSGKVGISAPQSLVPVEVGVMSGDNIKTVLAWQFFEKF
jgi:hypothetical protein